MSVNRYLEVLGLQPGVTEKEIKSAYRRLAKKYHPDVNPGEDAKRKFIEINEAYNFLTNVGPTPHEEEVTYNYNPTAQEYDARRAWARAKAEQAEREAREQLGIFFRKVNRVVALLTIPLVIFNVIIISDMLRSDVQKSTAEVYFNPLDKYGNPSPSTEVFQVAEWNLDNYTAYEVYSENFIANPDSVVLYLTPTFKKLNYVEFFKNGYSKVLFNPYNAYNLFVFKFIVAASFLAIAFFHATPSFSTNKITLAIVLLFIVIIEGFIFFLN